RAPREALPQMDQVRLIASRLAAVGKPVSRRALRSAGVTGSTDNSPRRTSTSVHTGPEDATVGNPTITAARSGKDGRPADRLRRIGTCRSRAVHRLLTGSARSCGAFG